MFIRLYEQVKRREKNGGRRWTCKASDHENGQSDKGAKCSIEVEALLLLELEWERRKLHH